MASPAQPDSADTAGLAALNIGGQLSDDDLAGIGYEAACPWLHEPMWREAVLVLPDAAAH